MLKLKSDNEKGKVRSCGTNIMVDGASWVFPSKQQPQVLFSFYRRHFAFVMVIVGCCTVPSWPGVLDLDMEDLPDSAHQLHVAAKYIGDYVHDLRPDIIGEMRALT